MRKTLIAANWKMHLNTHEASVLLHRLHTHIKTHRAVEIVLAPSMLTLQPLSLEIDRRRFRLAAQNAYYKDEGAYTGEVSFTMLHGLVHYAIIGHSERRIYFNEDLATVRDKVTAAVRNEITPILCVGETQAERENGETRQVIHDQVSTAVSGLTAAEVGDMVIAYEPVWAISSFGGVIAKPSDVEPIIAAIRAEIADVYGAATAEQVRILFGGSVNEHTVGGYLAVPGCDGALVGSASLQYQSFAGIVDVAYRTTASR